ncbi:competence type IV pilus ATPase ComGA [Alkalibacillus sp. S2W]|uniref:competence type IV pilus ATPase ComGA n=1 Tax=Alkalibacillus sp. S2W TaxID=3386553 RepID=UPI00398D1241
MKSPEQLSREILHHAVKHDATDIHFSPEGIEVPIYFRINGYRWFYQRITIQEYQTLISYYKFSSGMDIAEKRLPQDGTLSFHQDQNAFYLRLSTLPLNDHESLAIRILPDHFLPTLDSLFLFKDQYQTLLNWIKQRAGIILFTGPTGSGKSSTMFALMQEAIKQFGYQAISLEDPIERQVDQILQVQVNENTGFNYDVGLKAALRHDPDIITVGEIRDELTASFAFRAALTGHLVLTTVHAKDAVGTLDRLRDMEISTTDLSQTLIGIASQQLVPLTDHARNNRGQSRAAIAEILEGEQLQQAISGIAVNNNSSFTSFDELKEMGVKHGLIQNDSSSNIINLSQGPGRLS